MSTLNEKEPNKVVQVISAVITLGLAGYLIYLGINLLAQ